MNDSEYSIDNSRSSSVTGAMNRSIVDLNFHRAKPRRDFFTQSFPINNVPAFDGDDFVFGNVGDGK